MQHDECLLRREVWWETLLYFVRTPIKKVLRARKQGSSPVQSTLVPRAEYGRPPCRVRSSPVQGTTFSDTSDGLRMYLLDYLRPHLAILAGTRASTHKKALLRRHDGAGLVCL